MPNNRCQNIDCTKGLLTIGMVLAHVIQLLGDRSSSVLLGVSRLTNLVSFSGFLFCFGFAAWIAYISKPRVPWARAGKTAGKCYAAFCLSAVAYRLLVSGKPASFWVFFSIAALRDIPDYSEFLIAFALTTVIACLLAPVIQFITRSKVHLLAAISVLCLATFLPPTLMFDPWVGLFIGGAGFAFFPVVHYFPMFLLGAYAARTRHGYNTALLLLAFAGFLVYLGFTVAKKPFTRFPPSLPWLVSSAAVVYLYYGIARLIAIRGPGGLGRYLNAVGHNVLFYLLLSNLVLFAAKALVPAKGLPPATVVFAYLALMIVLYGIQSAIFGQGSSRRGSPDVR